MNQLTVFAIVTMVGAVAMMVFTALRLLAQRPRADEHIGWVSIALKPGRCPDYRRRRTGRVSTSC